MRKLLFTVMCLAVFSISFPNLVILKGFLIDRLTWLVWLVATVMGIFLLLIRGKFRRFHIFHLFFVLFVCWGFLSILWSVDYSLTLYRFFLNLGFIGIVWLLWEIPKNNRELNVLLQVYVVGAYFSIASIVFNYLVGVVYPHTIQRFSAFGYDPNDIGVILALGIPIASYLVFQHQREVVKWLNIFYVLFAFYGIFLTGSRTAIAASIVSLFFVIHMFRISPLKGKRKITLILTFIVGIVFIILIVPQASWDRIKAGIDSIASFDLTRRVNIWLAGLKVFNSQPLIGTGAGTFPVAVEPVLGQARSPHNTFISVLVEQGIIGFILFIVTLIIVINTAFKAPPLRRTVWLGLLSVWFVGSNLLGWDYRIPTWFIFGLLVSSENNICVSLEGKESG